MSLAYNIWRTQWSAMISKVSRTCTNEERAKKGQRLARTVSAAAASFVVLAPLLLELVAPPKARLRPEKEGATRVFVCAGGGGGIIVSFLCLSTKENLMGSG